MHVEILSSFVLGPGAVAEVGKVLPLQRGLALQAIAAGNARLVPDEPAPLPPAEPEAPEPAVVPDEPAPLPPAEPEAPEPAVVPDEPAPLPPAEPEAPEPAAVPDEPATPSVTPSSRSRRGAR